MTDKAKVVVQPFDASVLIDIYLDGATSGVASAAMILGLSETEADGLAFKMITALENDPAAMEGVRKQVSERVRGIDSGAYTLNVFTSEVSS